MATSEPNLGRLEPVDLRSVWMSEASDFTPWLAGEDNLRLLGQVIGIDLEFEAQEKDVGPFRADILCKDTANDSWVLIENQIARTDHIHLGQLLTYAAGLQVVTIVWIASRFTDEHRAALDWLNEITDSDFNFFGLEIELWRIGTSPVAPKFNVVSQPNDWKRSVAEGAARADLTEAKELQLRFWTRFRQYVQNRDTTIRPTKPHPQHWMNMAIGRSGFGLAAIASHWDSETESYDTHELRAEFTINENAAGFFPALSIDKDEIEHELGYPVHWHNPEGTKSAKIYVRRPADLSDEEAWPEFHQWLLDKLEDLNRVFRNRVRTLEPVAQ